MPKSTSSPRTCLVVLKFESLWNHHLLRKLELQYETHVLHADPIFRRHGSEGLAKAIERAISETGSEIVFFDADFYKIFDAVLIRGSARAAKLRALLSFDDLVMHDDNSVTATACDIVLTSDPLSVLRYREKGMQSEYLTLEASGSLYHDRGLARDIDVLHFGSIKKADRAAYIEALRQAGIEVALYGIDSNYVSAEELAALTSRAKIVLNFSKTDFLEGTGHEHPYYLQFKGRVIEAGLSGALCISEVGPGLDLLFPGGEVPVFQTPEECVALVRQYLQDDNARMSRARRLQEACMPYEDSRQMQHIAQAIEASLGKGKDYARPPRTYLIRMLREKLDYLSRHPGRMFKEGLTFNRRLRDVYPQAAGLSAWDLLALLAQASAAALRRKIVKRAEKLRKFLSAAESREEKAQAGSGP